MQKKILSVLIVLCLVTMILSTVMIIKETSDRRKEIDDFDELASLITDVNVSETEVETEAETAVGTEVSGTESEDNGGENDPKVVTRNLTPLFEKNGDCIGWIYIDKTTVNYPVMHTPTEPQRYLRRNFDREYSIAGIPFLDGACTLDCDNLIVFGHNMKNGTMFSDITPYQNEAYFLEHPVIEFETADGLKKYKVMAVVKVKSNDNWYSFRVADDRSDYDGKIADIKSRALYDTGVTPEYPTQLLTLSTCEGVAQNDRIIVIGAEIPLR